MPMLLAPYDIHAYAAAHWSESGRVASRVVRVKEAYDVDSELQQGADGA